MGIESADDDQYHDIHTWGYIDEQGIPSDAMHYHEVDNPYADGPSTGEQLAVLAGEAVVYGAGYSYTIEPVDPPLAVAEPDIYGAIARAEVEKVTGEGGSHHFQLPEPLSRRLREHLDDQVGPMIRPTDEQ
jgi:hypothetical protein